MPAVPGGPRGERTVDLAGIALKYVGAGYVYGGNASAVGDWDCSSFVSYCLHEAGLTLPGGVWGQSYMPPNQHGPVVVDYVEWDGVTAVNSPGNGILCCWDGDGPNGHIGIAISRSQMVSALNPTDGVQVTVIQGTGPSNVPLVYRKLKGITAKGVNPGVIVPRTPRPGKESWAAQIHATSVHFNNGRESLHQHTKALSQLAIRRN